MTGRGGLLKANLEECALVAEIMTGREDSRIGCTTESSDSTILGFNGEDCKLVGAVEGEGAGVDAVDGVVDAATVVGFCKLENKGPFCDMTVRQTFDVKANCDAGAISWRKIPGLLDRSTIARLCAVC